MKRRLVLGTLAVGALGSAQVARAQIGGADRTIRIVVGFPPGGTTDIIARTVAQQLQRTLKSTVIVDNRPGAGARIANVHVKGARPDGNTLLLTSSSTMAIYPHVFKTMQYDPLKDFVPVTSVVDMEVAYVASVAGAPGVKNLQEYVQWVKANPANGNCGVVALGTILHFVGFLLARSGGIQLNPIPYQGGAPQMQALNGGQLPFGIDLLGGVVPHLGSGRVKLLATSGQERSVPGVPTARESGFDELTIEDWNGLFYPAGTPAEHVQQVQAAIKVALLEPAVQESFRNLTLKPSGIDPAQFTRRLNADFQKWRKVVEDSGFKQLD